jgi:UDP-perosamine 4-acetyltransferase
MNGLRQALLIGTGGHSRVVLSLLRDCKQHNVLGIIDLEELRPNESIMGTPVIGSVSYLNSLSEASNLDIFLAIGSNITRRLWWEKLTQSGFKLPNLISPFAIVDPLACTGEANVICARAFLGPESVLGDNNLVNTGAILEHEAVLGSHCHLAPSSTVAGRTRIGNECFIGANATVIDRLEVAERTRIGAGATVISSIEDPGGTYVGTPARRKAEG